MRSKLNPFFISLPPRRHRLWVGVVGCLMVMTGTGCQVARIQDPLTSKIAVETEEGQLDFWHQLAERPLASNDEAATAIMLFAEGKVAGKTYEERITALMEKGLYPKGFSRPADEAVTRGTIAYALCKVLKIRGGLTMALTGTSERYATRELMDVGVFPISSPQQTFSGTELVGVISKAEDYQRGTTDQAAGSLAIETK